MHFEGYKKEIFDFELFNKEAKQDFEERLGKPDYLSSCIGLISLAFQSLEDKISGTIALILKVDSDLAGILTAELSFKNKLNLFSSLLHKYYGENNFNLFPAHENEHVEELIKALSKCEELRNRIMHSTFLTSSDSKKIIRQKKTSRAKRGFTITNEEINIYNLLNIYDFIVSMEFELDEVFH